MAKTKSQLDAEIKASIEDYTGRRSMNSDELQEDLERRGYDVKVKLAASGFVVYATNGQKKIRGKGRSKLEAMRDAWASA
jgi:hypothetical protein